METLLGDTATQVPMLARPLTLRPTHRPRPAAWHCASDVHGLPTVIEAVGVAEAEAVLLVGRICAQVPRIDESRRDKPRQRPRPAERQSSLEAHGTAMPLADGMPLPVAKEPGRLIVPDGIVLGAPVGTVGRLAVEDGPRSTVVVRIPLTDRLIDAAGGWPGLEQTPMAPPSKFGTRRQIPRPRTAQSLSSEHAIGVKTDVGVGEATLVPVPAGSVAVAAVVLLIDVAPGSKHSPIWPPSSSGARTQIVPVRPEQSSLVVQVVAIPVGVAVGAGVAASVGVTVTEVVVPVGPTRVLPLPVGPEPVVSGVVICVFSGGETTCVVVVGRAAVSPTDVVPGSSVAVSTAVGLPVSDAPAGSVTGGSTTMMVVPPMTVVLGVGSGVIVISVGPGVKVVDMATGDVTVHGWPPRHVWPPTTSVVEAGTSDEVV